MTLCQCKVEENVPMIRLYMTCVCMCVCRVEENVPMISTQDY